jgi:hypothetical protein
MTPNYCNVIKIIKNKKITSTNYRIVIYYYIIADLSFSYTSILVEIVDLRCASCLGNLMKVLLDVFV